MSFPLHVHGQALGRFPQPRLGRIVFGGERGPLTQDCHYHDRQDHVCLFRTGEVPSTEDIEGFAGILAADPLPEKLVEGLSDRGLPTVHRLRYSHHLEEGDVVALQDSGYVRTLYRRSSNSNSIFVTDRCNSYCLMCSQPPRPVDDLDRLQEHLRLVDLIDPECRELGITGGEPTLLGEDLLALILHCRERLAETALHMLTNGRRFRGEAFARGLAALDHPDLMLGIPLYSSVPHHHDHVVQAMGAFEETLRGLTNLGRYGVPVEIRIVIHQLTVDGLGALSEFIYRNLPFVAHVAFMGLEMMGFAVPNKERLWIDPWDYRERLEDAVLHLAMRGLPVSIYNHPLCLLPRSLWPYARQSISDWKNEFATECDGCSVRTDCGGFFTSTLLRGRSQHIAPIA